MKPSAPEEFSVGSVIVPARNGLLERLGHDVAALGSKALGIVVETRSGKALIQFPELSLSLWLGKDEMADVEARAAAGEAAFRSLLPNLEAPTGSVSPVWWVWALCRRLDARHILGFETGRLADVWTQEAGVELKDFYQGPDDVAACYVGLGIPELYWSAWREAERVLADRLLFVRFLPAGMHKLEIAVYLKL